MLRRGRAITALVAAVVVSLFVGRRLSLILTDHWWGSQISPEAGSFLLQWHLLRLLLDGAGVLVAATWFIGNLFIVYRALALVQVPRHVANLEIREALTPSVLLAITTALGAVLGILAGLGASEWWPSLGLAWYGVQYGVADPLLGHDLGVYVAQLPWWREVRSFALLLVVAGLAITLLLYAIVGSVRWIEGRPAISDHARAHLGGLLACLALCLAWGFMLLPYEVVAGLHGPETMGAWSSRTTSAHIMTGTAMAAAVLSLVWAFRPRHSLLLATWMILIAASVTVRVILPGLAADDRPAISDEDRRSLDRLGFAMEALERSTISRPAYLPQDIPASLPWSPAAIARLVEVDSATLLAMAPGTLAGADSQRSVWLTVAESGDEIVLSAIAADRTTAAGGAMSYLPGDTTAYPSVHGLALLDSASGGVWPGAQSIHVASDGRGLVLGSRLRRAVLAWGLQAGRLLGDLPDGARLTWRRDPVVRASRLAPFAHWTDVQPAWHEDRLWWLVTGFVVSETFPGTDGLSWGGRVGRMIRPGFLMTINAAGGETSLYLLPESGVVAGKWADVASDLVQPAGAIPRGLLAQLRYPPSMANAQARVLDRPRWQDGVPLRDLGDGRARPGGVDIGWVAPTEPGFTAVYHRRSTRRVTTLLRGRFREGITFLHLAEIDSSASIATPALLQQRWARFPLFEQIRDSIRAEGARVDAGPVRYSLMGGGLVAQSSSYASQEGARAQVAWNSVATSTRMGAGRTPDEAWHNISGESVPLPPGSGQVPALAEVRGWMEVADSALRVGDWEAFGRAFGALRNLLIQSED